MNASVMFRPVRARCAAAVSVTPAGTSRDICASSAAAARPREHPQIDAREATR
ncbi:MAG: hypothetical protein WDM77_08585 [Steroidobacteraceae bacterium]